MISYSLEIARRSRLARRGTSYEAHLLRCRLACSNCRNYCCYIRTWTVICVRSCLSHPQPFFPLSTHTHISTCASLSFGVLAVHLHSRTVCQWLASCVCGIGTTRCLYGRRASVNSHSPLTACFVVDVHPLFFCTVPRKQEVLKPLIVVRFGSFLVRTLPFLVQRRVRR